MQATHAAQFVGTGIRARRAACERPDRPWGTDDCTAARNEQAASAKRKQRFWTTKATKGHEEPARGRMISAEQGGVLGNL